MKISGQHFGDAPLFESAPNVAALIIFHEMNQYQRKYIDSSSAVKKCQDRLQQCSHDELMKIIAYIVLSMVNAAYADPTRALKVLPIVKAFADPAKINHARFFIAYLLLGKDGLIDLIQKHRNDQTVRDAFQRFVYNDFLELLPSNSPLGELRAQFIKDQQRLKNVIDAIQLSHQKHDGSPRTKLEIYFRVVMLNPDDVEGRLNLRNALNQGKKTDILAVIAKVFPSHPEYLQLFDSSKIKEDDRPYIFAVLGIYLAASVRGVLHEINSINNSDEHQAYCRILKFIAEELFAMTPFSPASTTKPAADEKVATGVALKDRIIRETANLSAEDGAIIHSIIVNLFRMYSKEGIGKFAEALAVLHQSRFVAVGANNADGNSYLHCLALNPFEWNRDTIVAELKKQGLFTLFDKPNARSQTVSQLLDGVTPIQSHRERLVGEQVRDLTRYWEDLEKNFVWQRDFLNRHIAERQALRQNRL